MYSRIAVLVICSTLLGCANKLVINQPAHNIAICQEFGEISQADINIINAAISEMIESDSRLSPCDQASKYDVKVNLMISDAIRPTKAKRYIAAGSVVAGVGLSAYAISNGIGGPPIWLNPAVALHFEAELEYRDKTIQKYEQWQSETSWFGSSEEDTKYMKELVRREMKRILEAKTKET